MDRKHQRKQISECINMQQEKDHNHFKNENKPWYIKSIRDTDESHDTIY